LVLVTCFGQVPGRPIWPGLDTVERPQVVV
jgi:hypothetical protein